MFENYPVDVYMKDMILEGGFFDETIYSAVVTEYDVDNEKMRLWVKDDLSLYSLDATYVCNISTPKGDIVSCEGVVKERYWEGNKKIIIFKIQKGFYKL